MAIVFRMNDIALFTESCYSCSFEIHWFYCSELNDVVISCSMMNCTSKFYHPFQTRFLLYCFFLLTTEAFQVFRYFDNLTKKMKYLRGFWHFEYFGWVLRIIQFLGPKISIWKIWINAKWSINVVNLHGYILLLHAYNFDSRFNF